MADFAELLSPDRVLVDLKGGSKRQVLRLMAERAGKDLGLSSSLILDALLEREKLGTTAIGDGMAIPHAKLKPLENLAGFFARLATPVDFDSLDDQPVDLVFLLLAPANSGVDHLKALARIARIFRDRALCSSIRSEPSQQKLFRMLTAPPAAAS